jgi:hypothetical protein
VSDKYVKDPADRLDYSWDWSDWLADVADTIQDATVTPPEGVVASGAPIKSDTMVTQWMEGGVLGSVYRVVCQITTNGGRIVERSITLTIAER